MKSFFILLFVAISAATDVKRQAFLPPGFQYGFTETCLPDEQVFEAYHNAYDRFTNKFYETLARREKGSFTASALTVWTTLAAIAEGSDYFAQKKLFTLLNLPTELCSRQKFYEIITTRIRSPEYITTNRALLIDEHAQVNPHWYGLIQQSALLDVIPVPIRYDPATTTQIINQLVAPKVQKIDLSGNAVLLNSLDYNGLWNTAFADSLLERSPFYNDAGEHVGSVDLMRVVRKARIGVVESLNVKVIELTIGANNQYSIIFALSLGNDITPTLRALNSRKNILEVVNSLKESSAPIDIAIPRLTINTELDLKDVLKDLGILSNLWYNHGATRYISTPAARPSTFIQRASITLNTPGISRPTFEYPVYRHASKEDLFFSEFIADRPVLFGLYDTETYTCLLSAKFSEPTYSLNEEPPVVNIPASPVNATASDVSA